MQGIQSIQTKLVLNPAGDNNNIVVKIRTRIILKTRRKIYYFCNFWFTIIPI